VNTAVLEDLREIQGELETDLVPLPKLRRYAGDLSVMMKFSTNKAIAYDLIPSSIFRGENMVFAQDMARVAHSSDLDEFKHIFDQRIISLNKDHPDRLLDLIRRKIDDFTGNLSRRDLA